MCVAEFLRDRADGMGPGETMTVDRDWIEWVLETYACECGSASTAEAVQGPNSVLGYSTAELADLFDNAVSTIKNWCALGVFGDPATLKPNGESWYVPEDRVAELRSKLGEGYQITSEGLKAPGGVERKEAPGTEPALPNLSGPTSNGTAPEAPRRRRRGKDRHNSWRQHVS